MASFGGCPRGAACVQFTRRQQHIHLARVEIDADAIAGLQQRQAAAHRRFRRDIQDRRRTRRAGLPPIAHRRQRPDAALQHRCWRLHVHHFGAARITHRTAIADDQHRLLFDAEIGILDAVVIVLRAFEHDRLALEDIRPIGMRQEALAEVLVDDADLHHRAVEQIARHHHVAGGLHHRIAVGADHLAIAVRHIAQVLRQRAAGDGHRIAMQLAGREQLLQHRRHAAGAMELLAEEPAGRLQIHQQRDVRAQPLPVVQRVLHAHVTRDRHHVDRAVRRRAQRRRGNHRILERLLRHDVGRPQILLHHADDALAGLVRHPAALAIRRGDRRAARQRHAKRLGQRVHRRRGAHRVAVADRRRGRRHHLHEFVVVDLALGEELAAFPDDRAGTGKAALPPAVQHRAAGQHDGRDVHRRRAHQAGGRRLVAAGGQHHAIDRIAVQHLHQAEIREVAIQRRGRPLAGLLDRMDREFQRHAAGRTNAVAHAARQLDMMPVARRQIGAGLGDADDRLAAAQLLRRDAVVHVALEIERGHRRIGGLIEPAAGAQPSAVAVIRGHGPALPAAAETVRRHGGCQIRSRSERMISPA